MRKLMMVLATGAMLAIPGTALAASEADLPTGCDKDRGQIVCTTVVEGKNPQGKFDETVVATTQGNLTNFSPEPQGVGVEEECNRPGATEKCPPGQFN